MDTRGALLSGLVATVLQTTLEAAGQRLGLSRMSLPFLIGTIVTPRRDRAQLVGLLTHFLNGWVFGFLYAAILQRLPRAHWWLGGALGLFHSLFLLTVVMNVLPAFHPRMASEDHGPTPTQQLEPPGFLALNYGRQTPILVVLGHMLYGVVFSALYTARPQR